MFNIKHNKNNPVLHPYKRNKWEEVSACNGCPIEFNKKTHLVYRAIANPDLVKAPNIFQSTIGVAVFDGKSFSKRKQFIKPEEDWEKYGCEDPRVTKMGKKFYTFYTALSSQNLGPDSIKVALAISDDLESVKERHLVTPFNAKAMAMFPEKINGKYVVVLTANTDNPPARVSIAEFDTIEDIWNQDKWEKWYKKIEKNEIVLKRNDSDLTEVGAPPVKTKHGWLLIYSHIQNYFSDRKRIFGIEAVLLDLKNPRKIIGRTKYPFIVPDQIYTKYGFVSDVSFPTGAILKGNNLDIYYGASDTTTCMALLNVDLLVREMKKETQGKLFARNPKNPVLEPIKENFWENKNVFNPGAIDLDGKVRILYRAQSTDGTSTIGYAESKDGKNISYRDSGPCYVPREEIEMKKGGENCFSGCEDPRLSAIGNKVFMTYTAYDGINAPKIAISSIYKKDLANRNFIWSNPVVISPAGHDDKDSCVLPKKFKDGYFMIHRISSAITGDYVNDLDFSLNEIDTSMKILDPRPGMWDSKKVGLASTPHLTKQGWLMFYHGVGDDGHYRLGAALLNKNNPTEVLARSTYPLFEPEMDYEKVGDVPNVVFPCGSVVRGDNVFIYYGGADRCVGVAQASLKKIIEGLQ